VEDNAGQDVLYPEIHVPPILLDDLFDDLFTPIARDGAAIVEIGVRLQKAFATLARFNQSRFRDAAHRHSRQALERAEATLGAGGDLERLRHEAGKVGKI
jgi:uncharacterized membrane protein